MFKLKYCVWLLFTIINVSTSAAFRERGIWGFDMNSEKTHVKLQKSLFKDSKIYVQITCNSATSNTTISVKWSLSEETCQNNVVYSYDGVSRIYNDSYRISPAIITESCFNNNIILKEVKFSDAAKVDEFGDKHIFQITKDGFYTFTLDIKPANDRDFNATVHIQMRGDYGYLSAIDWPLLPFYGIMCLVYVGLGLIWLTVSFLQWRDLLRIQFWIGGVILIGMLEKALFYAEYQNLNTNGDTTNGLVLTAEWISCGKRTLARMLVIIVSLGFGIVKPRLGSMLQRVVGTGLLYFILASLESYLRVMQANNDTSSRQVAGIPLAVLDAGICWWIFTSLVQTTRTLRLRRNLVKLALYRHFTNTLIFSVITSIIFMLYSLITHKMVSCVTDWKEMWVEDGFWHIQFSLLLLVIMVLWRPTNNNQRYAFTPLLDNPEDEDDDDEEDQFVADVYGIKNRGNRSAPPKSPRSATNDEDDLKWVEENIPAAIADAALPVLDSDEEIISTKFEVSKMQ